MKRVIKIGWLFPNTLYLHGERGNILALEVETKRRGYAIEVDQISLNTDDFCPDDYDFLFCPPGEMVHFQSIIDFLKPHQLELKTFIETRPFLATGTSIGLFGKEIKRSNGETIKGLGIIDVNCTENKAVYGDDLYYAINYNGVEMSIFGSQIQMMDIDTHNETVFGQLNYGYGNNGQTNEEGILKDKGIFTNTLGPLLICNPWLTEEIVNIIEKNKDIYHWDIKRDNTLEIVSLETKIELLKKKETKLTQLILREK
jgi:CobQ-like glutamine amidotransferase family enzyme